MRRLLATVCAVTFLTPVPAAARTAVAADMAAECPADGGLGRIIERARASNSDGLVILRHGEALIDTAFGGPQRPVYIASAGKSLVSMAIGRLLHTGLLDSLDTPLWTLFPEWKQGRKQEITVRHLLNHTSGIQNHPNASIELEPPPNWRIPDVVKLALAAELTEEPGTAFRYNNKAVALLGGVVERASGKRLDHFFETEFLQPLGITAVDWIRDEAGQPTAHGAFIIGARDLARFGSIMLGDGEYAGVRFFDAGWVAESFAPGQHFDTRSGLLWWRRVDETGARPDAWYADGYRGNFLVIIPDAGIVAARVKGHADDIDMDRDTYRDFVDDVIGMAACRTNPGGAK